MKILHISFLTCFILLILSCTEKDITCNGSCSEEYRAIVVYIEDSDGSPVVLDSIKVVDITNCRDITLQLDQNQSERGIYPIFSDKYAGDYRGQQLLIKFSGFSDGLEVISEVYKVGADCCHVYYISGNLELVI